MNSALLLLVALASGCASSYRVNPHNVELAVITPTQLCGQGETDFPVVINIRNRSRGILKIGITGRSGPPYKLSWINYDVLDARGTVDWAHGPGGHGPVPSNTLEIGPGDSTSVYATVYELDTADQSRRFMVRLEDHDKHSYVTDSFFPCVSK